MTALWIATLRDLYRRSSVHLLALIGVGLMVSLRWFSTFGLGNEVIQLKELGVYTLGGAAIVAAILVCLPREDQESDNLLLTRPIHAVQLAVGVWLGRATVVVGLALLWLGTLALTLTWFRFADPRLYAYEGFLPLSEHMGSLIAPSLTQVLTALVFLAFAQLFARTSSPVLYFLLCAGLYFGGYSVEALGWVRRLTPDFSRYDLAPTFWGIASEVSIVWLALHALLWCVIGLFADSTWLRTRTS